MFDRRRLLLGAAALGSSAMASRSWADAGSARVGVLLPRTPPGSVIQGTQILQGLQLATSIVNERGGLLGRKIELLIEDDQGLPERGRAAAEKLITRDGIVALTGIQTSSVALQLFPIVSAHNVPTIVTNGWSDQIRAAGVKQIFSPNMYVSLSTRLIFDTVKGLGAKSVVLFNENTEYGIEQAQQIGARVGNDLGEVKFRAVTLDRQSRDYLPAILPLRRDPPDMIIVIMLAPAAYLLFNQLYEQGLAPSSKTILFDGAGVADNPDFWQSVKEAGQYLLTFGLYHPEMKLPALGSEFIARQRRETPTVGPSRLVLQGADSIFLLESAAKAAQTLDSDALQAALRQGAFEGTRGTIRFSQDKGWAFQQWIDVPYVICQNTKVNQSLGDTNVIQNVGGAFDANKIVRPGR